MDVLRQQQTTISTGFEEYDSNTYEDYLTYRGMSPVIRQDMAAFLRRMASRQKIGNAASWKPSSSDWNRFRDVGKNTPHGGRPYGNGPANRLAHGLRGHSIA